MENTIQAGTKKGITGSTLKLIAIITMFIDHTAAVILDRALIAKGMLNMTSNEELVKFLQENALLYYGDLVMRLIGRLGFPIFCFLLIEGFCHTRDVKKYALRLGLFALLSEIPFDLAFKGRILEFTYQNVFFTLFIALLTLIAIQLACEHFNEQKVPRIALCILATAVGMAAASFLKTDYSAMGVFTVVVMYFFRAGKVREILSGCIVLTIMSFAEVTAFLTVIPIRKYNGTRGLNLKYIFYIFYPAHLFILYLISYAMGIA